MANSRIFTFGCSFTQYYYPTWADMICYKNDGFNFGQKAGGVTQILHKVANANRKHKFTELDKIIIMLPSLFRHDVGTMQNNDVVWDCKGSQHSNSDIPNEYMFMENLNNIIFLKEYLEASELCYWFTAMHDIFDGSFMEYQNLNEQQLSHLDYVSKIIDFEYPTMMESLCNIPGQWGSRSQLYQHGGLPDLHPTVLEHYEYATKITKVNISKEDILVVHNKLLKMTDVNEMHTWCKENFNVFCNQSNQIY